MSYPSEDENRRTHQRFTIKRKVEISDGDHRLTARLMDISAGGAALASDGDADTGGDLLQPGQHIDLHVEDMGHYGAQVIRELEEGYAVRFELDDEERGELIAEIMAQDITVDD